MIEECRQGHKVIALICGDTLFRGYKTRIRKKRRLGNIEVYSLTNPLTPTLIYGTSEPDSQHRSIKLDRKNLEKFIVNNNVEVMHIHTFMGLHKDVVTLIKSLGVKIIYTTHDFHGICPHYNLIDEKGILCEQASGISCMRCNANEPSDKFLRLANSSLYHFIKSLKVLSVKKKLIISSSSHTQSINKSTISRNPKSYESLLQYYRDYFKLIDTFHFNSSQTREKFEHFLGSLQGKVIPVITAGINDKRRPLKEHGMLTFGFIGSINEYKGFPTLKNVFQELHQEGLRNFRLKVYGSGIVGNDEECPFIEYCSAYKYSEISNVLYHLDGTIVPSKCYETFSLVTLESLAHGRPVIVSDHVGAKDIVALYNEDFVFSSKEELKALLRKIILDHSCLYKENEKILKRPWQFSIEDHTKQILSYYNER